MAVDQVLENIKPTLRQNFVQGVDNLPRNIREFEYKQGFFADVADEFLLQTTLGLAINSGNLYNGFQDDPEIVDFDVTPDMIEGYEGYESFFLNTKNQKHLDYKKSIIDTNMRRRVRLASSDRIFLPALVAGLGDPINYIPIPLFKGISFGRRFMKGGAFTGGTVAAFEPARRTMDPTSSDLESIYHVGSGFLLGGTLTGIFGKKVKPIIVNETIKKKGGVSKIEEKYHEAHSKTEGRTDWDNESFIYRFAGQERVRDFEGKIVSNNPKQKPFVRLVGAKSKEAKDGLPTLYINEAAMRIRWSEGKAGVPTLRGVLTIPRSAFKSADDYISFEIKVALNKKYFKVRKAEGESTIEYENRIRALSLGELRDEITTDFTTVNNFLTRTIEEFTPFGRILNMKFKNKRTENLTKMSMLELSGDFGTVQRAAREKIAVPPSVYMEQRTTFDPMQRNLLIAMQADYVKFKTGSSIPKNNPLDLNKQFIFANTSAQLKRVLPRILNRNTGDQKAMTFTQFKEKVHEAMSDNTIFKDPNLDPVIKEAAEKQRAFYAEMKEILLENEMFLTVENVQKQIDLLKSRKKRYVDDFKALADTKKTDIMFKRHGGLISRINGQIADRESLLKKLNSEENLESAFEQTEEYSMRIWRRDKAIKEEDRLLSLFEEHIRENPFYANQTSNYNRSAAREAVEKIKNQDSLDPEGILGRGKKRDGSIGVGGRPLMSRSFDIPTSKVLDFVETDVDYLARTYTQRVGTSVMMKKKYGDHMMQGRLDEIEHSFIMTELKTLKDDEKLEKLLQTIEDERDKMFGSISLQDPSTLSRRTAAFLRDWASLAFMGKVLLSATVDAARPIMVNGFDRTYNDGLKQWAQNLEGFAQARSNVKNQLGVATDLVLGNTRRRVIEEGGFVGRGTSFLGRAFDRVSDYFNNLQGPFYIINGLAPWTQMMKELSGVMSASRTLEDSIKWSNGTLDLAGQQRLLSYGIDKKTADLIARMPHENFDGLLTANTDKWGTRTGGTLASKKFKQAVFADVERTIITPSVADKPTMMDGVISITNPRVVKLMDNPIFRALGWQRTERGGKISNAFVGLPFQFMAWSFSANRKLLTSGLSDREQSFVSGLLAMISLGMFADYMKNPRYWEQKPIEEKIIRAVDQSGAVTIFTDINILLETVSGAMGKPIGIRPMFDQKPLFGEPNVGDAIGGFTGAGPSIPIDLFYAFMSDQTYDEKAATLRRVIPFQSLLWTNGLFKSIYNSGAEFLKPETEGYVQ
jgi:hypothetical protein